MSEEGVVLLRVRALQNDPSLPYLSLVEIALCDLIFSCPYFDYFSKSFFPIYLGAIRRATIRNHRLPTLALPAIPLVGPPQ